METKVVYDPVPVFLANKDVDTLVYVHEIAKNDQKLTVDVYTRQAHHARQALEDLQIVVDEMLDEWRLLICTVPPLVRDDKGKTSIRPPRPC